MSQGCSILAVVVRNCQEEICRRETNSSPKSHASDRHSQGEAGKAQGERGTCFKDNEASLSNVNLGIKPHWKFVKSWASSSSSEKPNANKWFLKHESDIQKFRDSAKSRENRQVFIPASSSGNQKERVMLLQRD